MIVADDGPGIYKLIPAVVQRCPKCMVRSMGKLIEHFQIKKPYPRPGNFPQLEEQEEPEEEFEVCGLVSCKFVLKPKAKV